MKRIEMSNGTVYATNNDGTGLFVRRVGVGAYQQVRGNGQFSARTVEALRRKLRDELDVRGVRVVAAYGWDQ